MWGDKGRGMLLCLVDLFASLNGTLGLTSRSRPNYACPQYREAIVHTISSAVDDDVPVDLYWLRRYATSNQYATRGLCQIPKCDLRLLLGIFTEPPRSTYTMISYRASKVVPNLSAPGGWTSVRDGNFADAGSPR